MEGLPQAAPEKSAQKCSKSVRLAGFLQFFSPKTFGGTLTLLTLAALALAAVFVAYRFLSKAQEIETLKQIIARLETERRVAQVIVRDQKTDSSGAVQETTLKFAELESDGTVQPATIIVVPGEEVYFDALVIKFERQYVELGDSLRGKNICLFRKVFGSRQKPEEGYAIDRNAADGIPDIYRTGRQITPFEIRVWRRFWEYADNPRLAAAEGVRIAQIEAVGIRPRPERIYTISIENAGGLNIKAEEVPSILRGEKIP